MNYALHNQMKRWYKLIDHAVQLSLLKAVSEGVRFPVVPAGRRSGKTERAKRFVTTEAMRNPNELYFLAAPTRDQVKKIFWDDMKKMTLSVKHTKKPSESFLIIYMPNGTEIHLIGLDKPERFEGVPWTGGVIDEIANVKATAWAENILPALNTVTPERPDYRAWCWLIGVPEGFNHYYEMAEYARTANDPEWRLFHWKSSDILPPDVIAAAKRVMSATQFRQEFEASFETSSGRVYTDYNDDNLTSETILPHEQIWWTHDQNFTPMSSAICVKRDNNILILDEIILESAVSRQTAVEFTERYKDHKNKKLLLYGDPAGRQGEKHGHPSDYIEIENVLRDAGWDPIRKVKKKAPAIKDRQNAVRAKVRNAAGDISLFVNAQKAEYSHKGLQTVTVKKGSTFQEEETDYQHITTAIGYMVDAEWPVSVGSSAKISIGGI